MTGGRRAMSPKGEEHRAASFLEVRDLVKHFQVGGGLFGGAGRRR